MYMYMHMYMYTHTWYHRSFDGVVRSTRGEGSSSRGTLDAHSRLWGRGAVRIGSEGLEGGAGGRACVCACREERGSGVNEMFSKEFTASSLRREKKQRKTSEWKYLARSPLLPGSPRKRPQACGRRNLKSGSDFRFDDWWFGSEPRRAGVPLQPPAKC